MTDSPSRGACPPAGPPALETAPDRPSPSTREQPPPSSPPSTACAVRRGHQGPAAAARSPSGRSLTPTPHPDAPNNRRRTSTERSEQQEHQLDGVDRPRSFRDDPHEADTSYAPGAETRRSAAHDVTARQCTPDPAELQRQRERGNRAAHPPARHRRGAGAHPDGRRARRQAPCPAQRGDGGPAARLPHRIDRFQHLCLEELARRTGGAATGQRGRADHQRDNRELHRPVSEELVSAYEYEKEHWLRNLGAARAGRAKALLRGEQVDIDSSEAILGYRLRQHQVGVICWTSASDACSSTGLKGWTEGQS